MPFDCSLAGMLKPLLKFNFEPGYCVLLCLWPALLSRPSLLLKPILETSVPPVAHGPIFKAFFWVTSCRMNFAMVSWSQGLGGLGRCSVGISFSGWSRIFATLPHKNATSSGKNVQPRIAVLFYIQVFFSTVYLAHLAQRKFEWGTETAWR